MEAHGYAHGNGLDSRADLAALSIDCCPAISPGTRFWRGDPAAVGSAWNGSGSAGAGNYDESDRIAANRHDASALSSFFAFTGGTTDCAVLA